MAPQTLVCLCSSAMLLLLTLIQPSWAQPSVSTSLGKINGVNCAAKSALTFAGIPYAVPPLGNLRFRAPIRYTTPYPSAGLNASATGPACVQLGLPTASEDCLTLNVYTPANATANSSLPVRVFLHGGGFNGGSAVALPYYDGCNSAAATNTIQVNVQYRLGFFGYLAHSATFNESNSTGAWGILDQQVALQWIQANIEAFGGNRSQVLLYGQSAGAFSGWIHLALPSSKGLFTSLMLDSGAGTPLNTLNQSDTFITRPLLIVTNCTNADATLELACLRNLTAVELLALTPVDEPIAQDTLTAVRQYPVVDGRLITAQPSEMLLEGLGSKVPVVVGNNKDEGNLITIIQFPPDGAVPQNLSNYIQRIAPPPYNATVSSQYDLSRYTPFGAISTIVTDQQFLCRSERALRVLAQAGIEVYRFIFTQVSACPILPAFFYGLSTPPDPAFMDAAHGFEVPYVFGWDAPLVGSNCSFSAAELQLSQVMMTSHATLARTGAPAFANGTAWPVWANATLTGLNLQANNITAVAYNYTAKCAVWDSVDSYYTL